MTTPQSTTLRVSLDQARAFWHCKQGLGAPAANPAEAIAATGWARTLGGIDVYLGVRARCPGVTRSALEKNVRNGTLRVVPAVRGCIYLVPADDVPVVMALAADLARPRTERDLAKAGSSWQEVEAIAGEVLKALAGGPLSTAAIRKALPEGTVRSLGDAGKKVGLSSALPVALRELEFRGEIERTPAGARLDTERYDWRVPISRPRRAVPADRAGRLAFVVRRFFEFFGPASVQELAAWVGVPQRDAKAAMAGLPLLPVAVEDLYREAWILEGDRDALADAAPAAATFSFLPFEDNLLTVHGGPGVLTDPAHHDVPVITWGRSKATPLGKARHLHYRALLAGEKLAGFWEYDPDADEVVTGTFEPLPARHAKALRNECDGIATFLRDELGHARSFSLDTDDGVRRRAAAIRGMG